MHCKIGIVVVFLLLFTKLGIGQELLTTNEIVNGIKAKRYYSIDENVHGGYQTGSLYIDETNFFYCRTLNGSNNIFLNYEGEEIRITNFDNIDIWEDVNQFGLTLVLDNRNKKLFFSAFNAIYFADYSDVRNIFLEKVYVFTNEYKIWAPFHLTKNGDYLSFTLSKNKISYMARLDLQNKSVRTRKSPFFGTEKPIANHVQINPFDHDMMIFAHEGSWVQDRLWMWDIKRDSVYNVWKFQKYVEAGHEFWSGCDGTQQYIYMVRYGSPQRRIPSGILRYDWSRKTMNELVSTNKFYLSHASYKNGYIVMDTYRRKHEGQNWIILYDLVKDIVYKVRPVDSAKHPAHPHPYFNTNGSKISFNHYNKENQKVEVIEIQLEEIIKNGTIVNWY